MRAWTTQSASKRAKDIRTVHNAIEREIDSEAYQTGRNSGPGYCSALGLGPQT